MIDNYDYVLIRIFLFWIRVLFYFLLLILLCIFLIGFFYWKDFMIL